MGRKNRSKRAPEPPRAAPDPLKTTQKPSKTFQRGPNPEETQDPPRSALGTVLRPSWDHPIARSTARPLRVNWCKRFGMVLASKMFSKTTPNRPPNVSKIKTKNASLYDRSWTRLGPVLGRSGSCLGVDFRIFSFENVTFREHRRFRINTKSRRLFVPT